MTYDMHNDPVNPQYKQLTPCEAYLSVLRVFLCCNICFWSILPNWVLRENV